MGISSPDFPSSAAFDEIDSALSSDPKEKKNIIKQLNAIFAFTLKNKAGKTDTWHVDLKSEGKVGKGEAPSGKKADVVISLTDEDFGKLVDGSGNAQKMFMGGKLKVKGNVMKATKMEPIFQKVKAAKGK